MCPAPEIIRDLHLSVLPASARHSLPVWLRSCRVGPEVRSPSNLERSSGFRYARKAILALSSPPGSVEQAAVRLRISALLAEAVSLNTLGLAPEAMMVMGHAAHTPGYRHEPESWLRSFPEQQLTAFARSPRVPIYQAEKVADLALDLVSADGVIQAGIRRRLLDVYITHATARSRRKADELAIQLIGITRSAAAACPLCVARRY